jgi:predicted RNA-binding Zn-ribbon protein involved in translation (DUF1610 family)
MSSNPCPQCLEQEKKRRREDPHPSLKAIGTKSFRGLMSGGWEETTYRCGNCGSEILHLDDKNEFPPFWVIMKGGGA